MEGDGKEGGVTPPPPSQLRDRAREARGGESDQGGRICRGNIVHGGVGGRRTAIRYHEAEAC